jgi:hypothetical protein
MEEGGRTREREDVACSSFSMAAVTGEGEQRARDTMEREGGRLALAVGRIGEVASAGRRMSRNSERAMLGEPRERKAEILERSWY